MKIEESPAKQQAVKKHIEQVVEQKLSQLDKLRIPMISATCSEGSRPGVGAKRRRA